MSNEIGFCGLQIMFLAWTVASGLQVQAQPASPSQPVFRVTGVRRSTEGLKCRSGAAELTDAAGQAAGCEFWEGTGPDARRIIELRTGARFSVEPLNATLVASGGKTILKYGNFANLVRPSRPVAWILYSSMGKVLADKPGTLDAQAAVAMADDGHFAVVGRAGEAAVTDESRLTLYSPSGHEIFSRPLGAGAFAAELALRSGARTIALALTDSQKYRDGSTDIVLFTRSGDRLGSIPGVRYPNAFVFVGPSGERLLAAARQVMILADSATAKTVWSANQFYRLAGPGSASTSPDGRYLYLITAELTGRQQDRHLWRAHAVSADTGAPLTTIELPGEHAAARTPVIQRTGERNLILATPERDAITIGVR